LRLHDHPASRPNARRTAALGLVLAAAALTLSACGLAGAQGDISNGYLPHGVTDGADRVRTLWIGAWLAALFVGVVVWGLTAWCIVVYRRRKDETGLPVQLRYNVPIEILYTVVPVFMIAVLFFYTARDESALLDNSAKPDVTINVVAKQWSWDFNYVDANTYESGTQAQLTGKPGVEETLPTLYLPVNKRVQFVLTARDVIHSFWVPAFLQKLDMIPGRVNRFQVETKEMGDFAGKCAELCGAYHSRMLFNVKVVDQATYDQHLADLRARGNTGQLDNGLNRTHILNRDDHLLPTIGGN
jgi:cytochrome c oxidase subunit II